jgi:hypothetical protein
MWSVGAPGPDVFGFGVLRVPSRETSLRAQPVRHEPDVAELFETDASDLPRSRQRQVGKGNKVSALARMDARSLRLIDEAAEREGLSRNAWMNRCLYEHAIRSRAGWRTSTPSDMDKLTLKADAEKKSEPEPKPEAPAQPVQYTIGPTDILGSGNVTFTNFPGNLSLPVAKAPPSVGWPQEDVPQIRD